MCGDIVSVAEVVSKGRVGILFPSRGILDAFPISCLSLSQPPPVIVHRAPVVSDDRKEFRAPVSSVEYSTAAVRPRYRPIPPEADTKPAAMPIRSIINDSIDSADIQYPIEDYDNALSSEGDLLPEIPLTPIRPKSSRPAVRGARKVEMNPPALPQMSIQGERASFLSKRHLSKTAKPQERSPIKSRSKSATTRLATSTYSWLNPQKAFDFDVEPPVQTCPYTSPQKGVPVVYDISPVKPVTITMATHSFDIPLPPSAKNARGKGKKERYTRDVRVEDPSVAQPTPDLSFDWGSSHHFGPDITAFSVAATPGKTFQRPKSAVNYSKRNLTSTGKERPKSALRRPVEEQPVGRESPTKRYLNTSLRASTLEALRTPAEGDCLEGTAASMTKREVMLIERDTARKEQQVKANLKQLGISIVGEAP